MRPPGDGGGTAPPQASPLLSPLMKDAAAKLQVPDQYSTPVRQTESWRAEVRHVYAEAYIVRGQRGRDRLVLLVRCWLCGRLHFHGAPVDFVSGIRAAGCGKGRYRLHVGTIAGQVAA